MYDIWAEGELYNEHVADLYEALGDAAGASLNRSCEVEVTKSEDSTKVLYRVRVSEGEAQDYDAYGPIMDSEVYHDHE